MDAYREGNKLSYKATCQLVVPIGAGLHQTDSDLHFTDGNQSQARGESSSDDSIPFELFME